MSEPKYASIKASLSNFVYTVAFNRPNKFNAFSVAQILDLIAAFDYANSNSDIKVMVITATGKYFSAGADLGNVLGPIPGVDASATLEEKAKAVDDLAEKYFDCWINFKKVLIAAVNGPAVGMAVTPLPLADFAFAVESATFHTPFMSLALCPEGCSSVTFPEIMGPHKASEFLILNKKFTAEEAKKCNLVSEVFKSAEDMYAHVDKIASTIASYAPGALLTAKSLTRSEERRKYLSRVNREEMALVNSRGQSDEARNAALQFLSKSKSMSKL